MDRTVIRSRTGVLNAGEDVSREGRGVPKEQVDTVNLLKIYLTVNIIYYFNEIFTVDK